MKLHIAKNTAFTKGTINITGSKSESNRLLLLQALYPGLTIDNLSNSDDSRYMQAALQDRSKKLVDIHHAGTAMRFLTAFFAVQDGREVTLTGSRRMQERPIKVLVEALAQLGADISYEKNEGYPPLRISGKKLEKSEVSLPADISSQYVSALLLIAPSLQNGLKLTLEGKITSVPYIDMTLQLLHEIGVDTSFDENVIEVRPLEELHATQMLTVESDWSSASYFYSIIALSEVGSSVTLSSYKQHSLQGDSVLADIYRQFGVATSFEGNAIRLTKVPSHFGRGDIEVKALDLSNAPDIAQTITVTCFGLGVGCDLYGLHTLPIKETDRLAALKTELSKLGVEVSITEESLHLKPNDIFSQTRDSPPSQGLGEAIDTYDDHRMAMAFAPLAIKMPVDINDAGVVSKSYPDFWEDLETIGFNCTLQESP